MNGFEKQVDYRRPTYLGILAAGTLTVLVIVGSSNLEHFDSALFGYTVASVVALGAIVFRYAVCLQRRAMRTYWLRGWRLFRNRKKLFENTGTAAENIGKNLIAQNFIFRRGFLRGLTHFLIMWGCILSAAITFPVAFGWVHFKLEGDLFRFPPDAVTELFSAIKAELDNLPPRFSRDTDVLSE